ncbi:glucoamylase family protein [Microbacterium sp. KSW4-11]|uniref:Glucoamylase family protein n=1 Tax=Microbacterium gawkjiense TaxID=3067309 RepID=A0ABU3G902_9MICO|nr:glucoamylase family protein [Microbacterium sp. KSW4-11]MDT3316297.1 glucoamylase family protein [Microbacterium sp. KSW4-11]
MTLPAVETLPADIRELTETEVDASIRWLWRFSTPSGPGCGLVLDRDDLPDVATVAATGFALAAWCVGVERGILDRTEVLERVRGTMRTLERTVPEKNGFLAHFVDAATGARQGRSEYSTIDTTLALCGAVVAASFFDDADVSAAVDRMLARIDWNWLAATGPDGRTVLRMAWVGSAGDDYAEGADESGFVSAWSMTAEQLTMYLLAAGHPDVTRERAQALWDGFDKPVGSYGGHECVYEPGGTLFTYHFPLAFYPFQRVRDKDGRDWWANSRDASLASRAWCADQSGTWRTFAAGLWGPAAGLGPGGYVVNGARPAAHEPRNDGTIPPVSLFGALPLAPDAVAPALRVLRDEHPGAWNEWGATDGINLEGDEPWYAPPRYGLNKGATALLGAAALGSTLVWDAFSRHPWIARGVEKLGFTDA